MNQIETTIDAQEINKFAQHSNQWWDIEGPLKTLHDINEARLAFVAQHLCLADSNILDVGCGGGVFSEAMAKAGAKITGIDAEGQAIQVASEHAKANQLIINYHCTPIEEFEHSQFDAITCMEMLEHVQKPELVLEQCKRLLKPDGLLFVSTISRTLKAYASAIIAAEYVLGLLPKQTHDYNKFIKPSELASIARTLDLTLVDMRGMNYNPISRQAHLSSDVSVNYLMAFQNS